MLALLGTSIGKYVAIFGVIAVVVGGGYLYIEHQRSVIATLTANNAAVTEANTDLQTSETKTNADVAANTAAQETANQQIDNAATVAATASQTVSKSVKAIGNKPSTANAAKINSDFATLLNDIAGVSK